MSELANLKRQIVRQTVAENLALKEGTRRARMHRFGPRAWRWQWIALAFILGSAGGSVLLSRPGVGAGANPSSANSAAGPGDASLSAGLRSRLTDASKPPITEPPAPFDPSLFPLEVRHIVLDPGHGGEDLGTRNSSLREKDLTLEIATRLRELLRADGFEVSMTRETDRQVVLRERRDFANRAEADLFVSIHINWIVDRSVRGVETYYLGQLEDPELAELTRRENGLSGYTLHEESRLIEGVIRHAQHERSRLLAGKVQHALFRSMRKVNPKIRDRGVKRAPFVVLIDTRMPAILAEVSCLSNEEEVRNLKKPRYLDHLAEALFKGIQGFARDVNPLQQARVGP